MTVLTMLRHTCSTSRQSTVGTNGRTSLSAHLTSVPCMFKPMSATATIQNNMEVGYGWTVTFQDGTDVQIGDRLTWNGMNYLVKGRQPYTGYGVTSYLRVQAETEHSNGQ